VAASEGRTAPVGARGTVGPRPAIANPCPVRCALATALLLAALGAAPAHARVALLATGTNEVALLDITTNQVVARPALPGPSRAVAVTRDGRRAFVGAGNAVGAFDLGMVPAAPLPGTAPYAVATRDLGAPVVGVAVSPGAGRVYAAAGRRLLVLDARTLAVRHAVGLRGTASALALSREGTLAAVVLDKGRVAMIAVGAPRLLRRVKVKGAAGVAFDAAGRAWVSGRGRLYAVRPGRRKPEKHPLRLGKGVSGAVAASPEGTTLAVGAARGAATAALVDVAGRHVRRFRSGRGPGAPGWSPDAVRVYLADGGGATLSLVSPFRHRRLGSVALPGTTPLAVAVQPGLARVQGSDVPDAITGTRLRDLIAGLAGDDALRGGRENDILLGGDGNDLLGGGSYDDRLDGGPGDDTLNGGSGNDRVEGGVGADRADGGTGDDSIHGSDGNDYLDGGPGDDHVFGEAGDDQIVDSTFGNDRRLYGGPGNDVIKGGRGSDLIKGGDGNDQLFGESGTENVTGGDGDDLLDGGAARDILAGNNGSDVVQGDSGDDTLEGGNGADQVDGGSGSDELFGDSGDDLVVGGPGPDVIDGDSGDDTIRAADDSRDEIDCGEGNDTVFVEADFPARDALIGCETITPVPPEGANDSDAASVISGTQSRDVLHGTPGDDSLFGKGAADKLFGGAGDDYVDGEYGADELHGGPGNDTMAGRSNDDRIFGDAGDDQITGDRGFDHISGGSGDDEIFGNLDPDTISGGPGNDRINVVRGDHDTVRCGGGEDIVFADPADRVASDCEHIRR
jgi:Ca2+-binding RTX toxin-like protein